MHPDGQPRQLSTLPHYGRTTRNGKFGLGRKPVGKRVDRTLRRIGAELRRRMHHNPYEVTTRLQSRVQAVSGLDSMGGDMSTLSHDFRAEWPPA